MSTYRFELRLPSDHGASIEGAELTVSGALPDSGLANFDNAPGQPRAQLLPFQDSRFEIRGNCVEETTAEEERSRNGISAFKAVLAGIAIGLSLPLSVFGMALLLCFSGPSLGKLGLVNPFGCPTTISSVTDASSVSAPSTIWAASICQKLSIPFSGNGPFGLGAYTLQAHDFLRN